MPHILNIISHNKNVDPIWYAWNSSDITTINIAITTLNKSNHKFLYIRLGLCIEYKQKQMEILKAIDLNWMENGSNN